MDRKKLQRLARERLKDARPLLGRKRWASAYYLSSYAVECGLKACLLRHLGESGSVFGELAYLRKLSDCWTHDLVKLVKLAGLDADFGAACGANPALENFWRVTKGWTEASRFEETPEAEARRLYEAVSHKTDGVLRWIHPRFLRSFLRFSFCASAVRPRHSPKWLAGCERDGSFLQAIVVSSI